MANKIGIVLALDGEKEFANGMKSARESAKLFDQELKNLESEYKGNSNSLEALTKKQDLLRQKQQAYNRQLDSAKSGQKNAIKNYQDATKNLDKLEKELDEARQAMKRMEDAGDTSSKAYRDQAKAVEALEKKVSKQADEQAKASTNITKWDTAVAKANGDVKKINTEVDKNSRYVKEASQSADKCATSIDNMGNEMDEAAGNADKMGGSFKDAISVMAGNLMSKGIDMLVTGLKDAAKYVVEVGSRFEASMSKVEALSGASAEQLARLSDKAKELGSSTMFSASEVADAFGYMSLAGWDTESMLQGIDGVLNLAAASGMDLASASDMVTDYLSAFSLTAADASHMVDMLAYAQANSNTTTQQLGDAFGNCAANMNAAGQDMETTTAILEAFANQGIKGSEAGTKLSAIMRDITAKMKDGKIQIGDTAVAVTDANGNFRDLTDILADVESATNGMGDAEKAAALSATFTSRSVGGLNMILNEGVGNIAAYEQALRNSDGAASDMAATMQNNFSGAVKDLDSKVESLGIAVWEKIQGPITGAVETLSEIISGITSLITPEQTALEKFIDDIGKANEAVQQSIEHARSTVESGEAKAAEITAYGEEIGSILEQCEQFNQVTLENGETAIIDSAGNIVTEGFEPIATEAKSTEEIIDTFASGGLNTEGIISSANDAKTNIGYISEKVDSVGETLKGFNRYKINTSAIEAGKTAVVQIFNDMNEVVGTVQTNIGDTGKVSIPTDTIGEGTTAIITCFDDTTGSVERFKTSVDALAQGSVDLSTITTEFERVQDSITTTYHITDEFTKIKIDTMVSALGDSVQGLAEAWDSQTGTLRASKEELEDWFDTAKQVAMNSALQSAINELYSAWGDAAVNMAKANSAVNTALKEFNEEAGTSFKTAEEALDWMNNAETGWYDTAVALNDAVDKQDAAAESMRKADKEIHTTADSLKGVVEGLGDESSAAESAAESNDGLAESFSNLTEDQEKAISAFQEMSGKTGAEIAAMQSQLNMSNEDFANWCTQRAEETKQVIDAYQKLVESVAQSMHEFATAIDTSGEEGSSAIDNMVSNLTAKTTELRTWVDNMKTLGQMAGRELPQGLYDELLQGGPAKTAEAVQALVDAAQNETGKFEEVANQYNEALTIEAEAGNLAQYSSTGKAYAEAVKEGFVGSQADYEAAVAETMENGASAAQEATSGYTEAGAQATDNLASGQESEASAVASASQAVVEGGVSAANTAIEMFKEAGRLGMISLSIGMNSQKDSVARNATSIVSNAKTQADTTAKTFKDTGSAAGSSFTSGLNSQRGAAVSAGAAVASGAKMAAATYQNSFYSIGSFMGQGLSQGIMAQAGNIARAAAAVVSNALAAARAAGAISSPSKKFRDKVGKEIGAGVAWGIKLSGNLTTEAAESMVGNVLASMKKKLKGAKSSEISYAWLQTAQQMIKTGFGINKLDEKGNAKSIETYYKDVFSQASNFMSNLQVLYNVSEENQLTYWKKVQSSMKRGTQAWYDATAKVRSLQADIKEAQREQAEKELEEGQAMLDAQREQYENIMDAADNYMDFLQRKQNVSIKKELEYWKTIRKALKSGTDAYNDATNKIKNLENQIGSVSNAEKILSIYKTYFAMTAGEEVEYWDLVRKSYAAGTEERITADQKYLDAKKNYTEKLKGFEEEYAEAVSDVQKRIAEGVDELNKKYEDAVKQRAEDIAGAFDLFDAFESTSPDGKTLLFNIESQAAGYEFWTDEISKLEDRGILSEKLLQEIIDKGPEAVADVFALNSLTDEELERYQTAYDKKWDIALKQSEKENEGLKKTVEKEIEELQKDGDLELKKLRDNFDANTKSLSGTLSEGLKTLASNIRNIADDEVAVLTTAIRDARASDTDTAGSIGGNVNSGTASVAPVEEKTGSGDALRDAALEIITAGAGRSRSLTEAEQKNSGLFKHIVQNYGVTPTNAMYKALAGMFGVAIAGIDPSYQEKKKILEAMTSHGLASGTKNLRKPFAWMDEMGLGSELIVRKSDGAILNTAVQMGDAIIPADLTNNLYKWGAIDPDSIPHVMSTNAMNARLETGYRAMTSSRAGQDERIDTMLMLMERFMPFLAERPELIIDGKKLVSATSDYTNQDMLMRSRRYRG